MQPAAPRMNLLFVSSTFPDAAHPARGTYNGELCLALAQQHGVAVIAPRAWPEVVRSTRDRQPFTAPPAYVAAGIDCRYPTYLYTPGILQSQHARCMWFSIRDDVIRLNRRETIEGVLSYWAHPDGEAGLRAARLLDVPHVVIVGGADVLLVPQHPGRDTEVSHVLRNSQAVVTVSEGLRRAVVELGVPAERVHTIYQGIDPEVFHRGGRLDARARVGLTAQSAQLLWVGRMVDVKALNILLEACVELKLRQVEFQLWVVGEGPLRPELEQAARDGGLESQVQFVGPVGHDQLADWYGAADVTLLTSWWEGLPNVLRESLACGTPFVSTNVGSIPEIADPEFCVLVDPGDPGGLADGIITVLNGDHRQAAARYVPRTWSACSSDVMRLFSTLHSGVAADLNLEAAGAG